MTPEERRALRIAKKARESEVARERRRARDRARGDRRPRSRQREYRRENREKILAQQAVGRAIRAETLVRQPCEVCGATENVHAHHDDYTKPLDVRWLCPPHHGERESALEISRGKARV